MKLRHGWGTRFSALQEKALEALCVEVEDYR
jgi:hypothetical protein